MKINSNILTSTVGIENVNVSTINFNPNLIILNNLIGIENVDLYKL
jgi:hypothetical protein